MISKSELAKLVRDMSGILSNPEVRSLYEAFPMKTGDSDALCVQVSLSQEELTNSCWVEMDADGDGSITSQEFVTSVLRQDRFTKQLAVTVIEMFT